MDTLVEHNQVGVAITKRAYSGSLYMIVFFYHLTSSNQGLKIYDRGGGAGGAGGGVVTFTTIT